MTSLRASFVTLLALGIGCSGSDPVDDPAGVLTVVVAPDVALVPPGTTKDFDAVVIDPPTGASDGVTWSLAGAGCAGLGCGSVLQLSNTAVRYFAPPAAPNPPHVLLTARSEADTAVFGRATVTIGNAYVGVTLAPGNTTVPVATTAPFTATVTGDGANNGVTWSLGGAMCAAGPCGSVSLFATGSGEATTYIAPVSVGTANTLTITATSVSDISVSATATITITP